MVIQLEVTLHIEYTRLCYLNYKNLESHFLHFALAENMLKHKK